MAADNRIDGILGSLAIKAPCKAVAIVNITLSGEQTVNSVAVVTNDRVLVTNQTSSVDNGVYDVKTTAWARSADMDGNRDLVDGTVVVVKSTPIVGFYQLAATNPVVVGTTALTFSVIANLTLAGDLASTANGKGASLVGIEDANSKYDSATVEAALDELIESGTFTINWIGFSGSITSTAVYRQVGKMVLLRLGTAFITGTSDTQEKKSTTGDIPIAIRPTVAQQVGFAKTIDNGGLFQFSYVAISAAGIISVHRDAINTLWTASGSATIDSFNLVYYI